MEPRQAHGLSVHLETQKSCSRLESWDSVTLGSSVLGPGSRWPFMCGPDVSVSSSLVVAGLL